MYGEWKICGKSLTNLKDFSGFWGTLRKSTVKIRKSIYTDGECRTKHSRYCRWLLLMVAAGEPDPGLD